MRRLLCAFNLREQGASMIFEPFKPFLASAYQIKFATEAWEQRGAAALRRAVYLDCPGLVRRPRLVIQMFGNAPIDFLLPSRKERRRRCRRRWHIDRCAQNPCIPSVAAVAAWWLALRLQPFHGPSSRRSSFGTCLNPKAKRWQMIAGFTTGFGPVCVKSIRLFLNYLPEQPWYISQSMQPVLLF